VEFLTPGVPDVLGQTKHTSHTAMPFQAGQSLLNRALQKCLLGFIDVATLPLLSPKLQFIYTRHTFVTRKQRFIRERTVLSGTILYTSG
jgi:hypothetical protein